MKKSLMIGLIIVVLVVVFGIYYFANYRASQNSSLNCAKAGEASTFPTPDFQEKECCSGLVEINGCLRYQPGEDADENGCVSLVGCGAICSNCGNDICESWENRCNCPEDCAN